MEENTSLHTECAHKPRPAVLNQFSRTELLLDTLWKHWLAWALEHWI